MARSLLAGLLCVTAASMAMLFAAGCSGALGGESPKVIEQAADKVYPSIVRIRVVMLEPSQGRMQKLQASGSGVIISKDGYVVTNHHVAGSTSRIVCDLANRQEVDAVLVGTDPMTDIAVLKLDLAGLRRDRPELGAYIDNLPTAPFGDSDKLRVGDPVLAIGSPAGLSQSVTLGIVSNTEMILPGGGMMQSGEEVGQLVRWIGHDAKIWHGNSGGPLLNTSGEIVGINEMGVGGIGGAIPGNLVCSVARQLIKSGSVKRSYIGVECQTILKCSHDHGVLVAGVMAGSPGSVAGIKAGDIITEFDGVKVNATVAEDLPVFNQLILSRPIGKPVKVVLLRDGKSIPIYLQTEAREKTFSQEDELKGWGVTAMDLTAAIVRELGRTGKEGVLVNTVRPGGPCSDAKPAIGSEDVIVGVNGQKIVNVEQLRKLTEEITKNGTSRVNAMVEFERGSKKFLTVVRVGKEDKQNRTAIAKKAWLGVTTQVLTRDLAEALALKGKKGVRVTQVVDHTAAKDAGLKVGDIILKVDDEVVSASNPEDDEVFPEMIRQRTIGTTVTLGMVRDGKETAVPVKLEAPPTPVSDLKVYEDDDFEFSAREMSFLDRQDKKVQSQGVLVTRVENSGWAALGGLAVENVIMTVDGKPIANVDDLKAALKDAKTSKCTRIVLFVKHGVHTRYLELQPAWSAK
jgi:serine protease Do